MDGWLAFRGTAEPCLGIFPEDRQPCLLCPASIASPRLELSGLSYRRMRSASPGPAPKLEANGHRNNLRPDRRRISLPAAVMAAGWMLSATCLLAAPEPEALTNVVQVRNLSIDEAQ